MQLRSVQSAAAACIAQLSRGSAASFKAPPSARPQSKQVRSAHHGYEVVIDEQKREQPHQVADREFEGSDWKLGAAHQHERMTQEKRIENEGAREIEKTTHAGQIRQERHD